MIIGGFPYVCMVETAARATKVPTGKKHGLIFFAA